MKKNNLNILLDYLFCFSIILCPFYFFKGSMPQLFHYTFLLSFILIIINYWKLLIKLITEEIFLKIIICLAIYSVFINLYWSYSYKNYSPMLGSIKLSFTILTIINFFFLINYKIINHSKLLIFLIISLLLQLIIFILINQFNYNHKPINFFYYKTQFSTYLLILNFLFIYYFNKQLLTFQNLILLFLSTTFLLFMSGSIYASIINFLMLVTTLIMNINKIINLNTKNILLFLFSLLLFFLYFLFLDNNLLINLQNISSFYTQDDANFAGRGYLRLLHNWEYLFFGAGYGLNFRFLMDIDLHSTHLNVFFQYGIVGLVFILFFLYRLVSIDQKIILFNYLIFLCYSIAHDLFNQSFFWLLFILITTQSINKKINDF